MPYGGGHGRRIERDGTAPPAGGGRRRREPRGAPDGAQAQAAADDRAAPGPEAARTDRPVRRDPGGVRRGDGSPGRVPRPAQGPVLPLAEVPRQPEARGVAPSPPGHPGPGRPARGLALPRRHARRVVGGPGGPAHGRRGPPQRGGDPRRDEDPAAGGPELPRPDRPRGAGASAFRATQPRGGRARAGDRRGRREPALRPRPAAHAGSDREPARGRWGFLP